MEAGERRPGVPGVDVAVDYQDQPAVQQAGMACSCSMTFWTRHATPGSAVHYIVCGPMARKTNTRPSAQRPKPQAGNSSAIRPGADLMPAHFVNESACGVHRKARVPKLPAALQFDEADVG